MYSEIQIIIEANAFEGGSAKWHYQEIQLSRITISGFKSIKRCDIKFRKVNVLIGSNGAGKSNFISAFTLLQNILSQNLKFLWRKAE